MHTSMFSELLTYMMEDPRNITPCMHLLFIAKDTECMRGQATNVAEQVHFLVVGKNPEEPRPKQDGSSTTTVEPTQSGDSPERTGDQ